MTFRYITAKNIIPWQYHRNPLCLGFLVVAFILLSSVVCSAFEVKLSWDPSSSADGYRVFLREDWDKYNYGNPEWEGSDTTCTIFGLPEGLVYYFVVRAFNEYGESYDSNEVRSWARISGTITYEGSFLCALVLANGQYIFTCGENLGLYDLKVPVDQNNEIILHGFCSGLAPFKAILTPEEALDYDINMTRAAVGSPEMTIFTQTEPGATNPNWVRVRGTVTYDGTPLCATMLVNGQNTFSCGDNIGIFDMEVPLDQNGEITFYGFCSGFAPYKKILTP